MGILISSIIVFIWAGHLLYSLSFVKVDFHSPLFLVHLFFQSYLYTGLFITSHDAMHGNIDKRKSVNKFFGYLSAFLFAGMSYNRLIKNHIAHHKYPGEKNDPDYYIKSQNFFVWWGIFFYRYTTILQIFMMGVIFNLLKLWFDEISIWFFWVIPALIGTLQLFYFGTYLPHKQPHTEIMFPHNARTQKRNHFWAMLSCYFFGYHWEHHESPKTPWWKLYKQKRAD
jgi:beta-carotene ketolase (CrtW type)